MRLSDFDYDLPDDLIARRPARPRDASRMLVVDARSGTFADAMFRDLAVKLKPSDTLVLNDTRVIRARLRGTLERKNGSSRPIEVFFAEPAVGGWRVLCRPGRRIRPGDRVTLPGGFRGVFENDDDIAGSGLHWLRFESDPDDVNALLDRHGEIPLPPYLARESDSDDHTDYQTVFAGPSGAVAAPTAGLHFTADVLSELRDMGIRVVHLTLHVGIGTFLPVRADNPEHHVLRPERFNLSAGAAEELESARREGRRIVAVGTTVTRTLEYVYRRYGAFRAAAGETDLFILPGFEFRAVDALLTNFHLPRSTLLMLTSAFAGRELMLNAYRHAVRERYRFYSYGDAMLIVR